MRIFTIILTLSLLGCEETKPHKAKRHHVYSSARTIKPQEITSDQYSIIVPDAWMVEYERMEKKHGKKVDGDATIWQEGARYHIPQDVAQNYIDLKRSDIKKP